MYPFYLELELIHPIVKYFEKQDYIVKREIRIGFCRADIVAFKKNKVIAVELKLRDWKKAIVQAKNYQLGADYVYLAFPLMKSYNVIRKAESILKKEGIGLLVINEKNCIVKKIVKAKKSSKKMGTVSLKRKRKEKFRHF